MGLDVEKIVFKISLRSAYTLQQIKLILILLLIIKSQADLGDTGLNKNLIQKTYDNL